MTPTRAAVVTVSDGVAQGTREDGSGDAAEELLRDAGFDIAARRVVPDEREEIESALRELAADHGLVVTTGGTGFGPRDVTPEATRAVIEREAPGFAEAMRAEALKHTPMGILSRGVSGIAGRTLIVNFPGNPKAIGELFGVIGPTLGHVVATLQHEGGPTPGH
jgi:molybdopterin adenylyltransferase